MKKSPQKSDQKPSKKTGNFRAKKIVFLWNYTRFKSYPLDTDLTDKVAVTVYPVGTPIISDVNGSNSMRNGLSDGCGMLVTRLWKFSGCNQVCKLRFLVLTEPSRVVSAAKTEPDERNPIAEKLSWILVNLIGLLAEKVRSMASVDMP